MCGRYSFAPDLKIVNEHYDISVNDGDLTPNYNCAPSQLLPVITNDKSIGFNFFAGGLFHFGQKISLLATSLSMQGARPF